MTARWRSGPRVSTLPTAGAGAGATAAGVAGDAVTAGDELQLAAMANKASGTTAANVIR
ncbi:MAG TPA: hypothetical protein VN600_14910 [Gemmatimonadaceae bacterium]|nr:hypothetical protein [Gemmatimonadaceae bacterium]